MEKFEAAFGVWVIRYRWLVLLISLIIVGLAGSGIKELAINNDLRVFFSEENPQLIALESLENTYNKNENVLFVIGPKDGNIFSRKTLGILEELTDACWKIPYSSRVNSLTNFQFTAVEEDDLLVADLVKNANSLSGEGLERIRSIALGEPQLVGNLISPKGDVSGIMVTILKPDKSPEEVNEVALYALDLRDKFRAKYPDTEFYVTGTLPNNYAFGKAAQEDMSTLVPAMFLTLLVIAGVALRSVSATIGVFLVILFSVIIGMGTAGWLGISITAASANAPTIILTLAVADSIHLLASMIYQMATGKTKQDAIKESLRQNLQPVFLTSLTTVVGFLSMNFSDAPPFRDVGNIVSIGIVAAFFYSVLFLPALMSLLPVKTKPESVCNRDDKICRWIAETVVGKQRLIFWGMLTGIVLLVSGLFKLELNDDWIKYFDKSYDIRVATDYASDRMTGFHIIEYSLKSGETGGINEPDYLKTVEAFANWFRKQEKVVNVNVITNTMKRLNRDMHGGDPAWYKIPEDRELAAQYLLMYEMSLPFGLDLNDRINIDKSESRMIVTMRDMTTTELRDKDDRAREWLKTNAPEGMFTYGSGISIIWAHISERNINSMLVASLGALVLISAILILALRSFKLGFLSLIPNLAPAFMAFGVWGYVVGQAGLGLSVLVAMTLGIVVDDTVHFMSKYTRARREHAMEPEAAVEYTFYNVGTAMWITTLALTLGFLVLTLSGYRMNADIGAMTAVTILLALALDFLLLPVLLVMCDSKEKKI